MAAAEDNNAERIAALEAQLAAKDAQLEKLQLHIVELEATPEKSAPSEWFLQPPKGWATNRAFSRSCAIYSAARTLQCMRRTSWTRPTACLRGVYIHQLMNFKGSGSLAAGLQFLLQTL